MRNHYWTCSKFADWLRGSPKGGAKTSGEWRKWEIEAKSAHPIRWWLAEEGLDANRGAGFINVTKLAGNKAQVE